MNKRKITFWKESGVLHIAETIKTLPFGFQRSKSETVTIRLTDEEILEIVATFGLPAKVKRKGKK